MHLFFSDLDGTLLNQDSLISDKTRKALDSFLSNGHKLILSSGRPIESIQHVMKINGLDAYSNVLIISYNGSLIYDTETRTYLNDLRLPLDDAEYIMERAENLGIHCHTYCGDYIVCKRSRPEADFYMKTTGMKGLYHENPISLLSQSPHKVVAISFSKKELYKLKDELTPWMGEKYICFFSCEELLEFVDSRSGKGNAVRIICDRFQIPVSEVYAAGDADNDLSMLEVAGHSIAMKNASEDLKTIASFITERDNRHDGLADILSDLAKDNPSI